MTTDGRDVVYSNYAPAFGHIDTANDAIKRKMANEANVMLAPFCALRNKAR
jgi:hypothetical protein